MRLNESVLVGTVQQSMVRYRGGREDGQELFTKTHLAVEKSFQGF